MSEREREKKICGKMRANIKLPGQRAGKWQFLLCESLSERVYVCVSEIWKA